MAIAPKPDHTITSQLQIYHGNLHPLGRDITKDEINTFHKWLLEQGYNNSVAHIETGSGEDERGQYRHLDFLIITAPKGKSFCSNFAVNVWRNVFKGKKGGSTVLYHLNWKPPDEWARSNGSPTKGCVYFLRVPASQIPKAVGYSYKEQDLAWADLDFDIPMVKKYFNPEAILGAVASHDSTCPSSKQSGRCRRLLKRTNYVNRVLSYHEARPGLTTYEATVRAMLTEGFRYREQPTAFQHATLRASIEGSVEDMLIVSLANDEGFSS
jgi:hypothetical protein